MSIPEKYFAVHTAERSALLTGFLWVLILPAGIFSLLMRRSDNALLLRTHPWRMVQQSTNPFQTEATANNGNFCLQMIHFPKSLQSIAASVLMMPSLAGPMELLSTNGH